MASAKRLLLDSELNRRIGFTVATLIVYRIGTFIPIPGVDATVTGELLQRSGGGIFGIVDLFSGGAFRRSAIFALNIMPYMGAEVVIDLLAVAVPSVERLKRQGEDGRKTLDQYARYVTLLLALASAYGTAVELECVHGTLGPAVPSPGVAFRLSCVIVLTGGAFCVMWLSQQITARGLGNGASLIIVIGMVANLPEGIASLVGVGRTGALSPLFVVTFAAFTIAMIAFVVFVELAERRITVQYPKRQVGNRMFGGDHTHMPLKVNAAGSHPVTFANSILLLPGTVAAAMAGKTGCRWLYSDVLSSNRPLYLLACAAMIIFFSYFYTPLMFKPDETADNLKKYGGFIPGIRPGRDTATYLGRALTRLTAVGGPYLVAVCLLPQILVANSGLPFYFEGTSILIVVSVTIDIVRQIQAHLVTQRYEGLIPEARLRGRR